jgi:glycine/D-amino acid oxidase-like deaminating enzyme
MTELTSTAKAVVIGGGIVGCSVAYHLGKLGWSDTVLLERGSKHVGGGPAAAAAPCGREPGI